MLVWCGILVVQGSSSVAAEQMSAAPQSFSFDIPRQSLDVALIAFSTVTGFELVYESAVIRRLGSSAVRGQFTAEEAVAQILRETGLRARKVAATTITISRDPENPKGALVRRPEYDPHAAYFAAIQDSLKEAFCDSGIARVNGERLIMRFRVTPGGEIAQLEMLDLSNRDGRRPAIADALSRLTLKKPPPADLPQPLMGLVRPMMGAEDLRCVSRH